MRRSLARCSNPDRAPHGSVTLLYDIIHLEGCIAPAIVVSGQSPLVTVRDSQSVIVRRSLSRCSNPNRAPHGSVTLFYDVITCFDPQQCAIIALIFSTAYFLILGLLRSLPRARRPMGQIVDELL
jgi:hypothetical protein